MEKLITKFDITFILKSFKGKLLIDGGSKFDLPTNKTCKFQYSNINQIKYHFYYIKHEIKILKNHYLFANCEFNHFSS